jgi:DNA polymerase epsilon subunit 1
MSKGRGTFGLTSSRGRGRGGFRGGFRGAGSFRGGRGRGRGGSRPGGDAASGPAREDDGTQLAERFDRVTLNDEIDDKLGFARVQEGATKEGWLINMHPVSSAAFVGN